MLTLILVQLVVKSQILAGGRGLGTFKSGLKGGVHIVKTEQVEELAGNKDDILFFILSLLKKFCPHPLLCIFRISFIM